MSLASAAARAFYAALMCTNSFVLSFKRILFSSLDPLHPSQLYHPWLQQPEMEASNFEIHMKDQSNFGKRMTLNDVFLDPSFSLSSQYAYLTRKEA